MTSQIKSQSKPSLCIEIEVGGTDMMLKTCDTKNKNANQKITFDAAAKTFRNNARKYDPQCFYDRGLYAPGTGFTTWSCGTTGDDQNFGFKYQDVWLADQQAKFDALARGERFLLCASMRNNMCVGVNKYNNPALFPCDVSSLSQQFQWDTRYARVRYFGFSPSPYCMEYARTYRWSEFTMARCDGSVRYQTLEYSPPTREVRFDGICLTARDGSNDLDDDP